MTASEVTSFLNAKAFKHYQCEALTLNFIWGLQLKSKAFYFRGLSFSGECLAVC